MRITFNAINLHAEYAANKYCFLKFIISSHMQITQSQINIDPGWPEGLCESGGVVTYQLMLYQLIAQHLNGEEAN